MPTHRIAHRLFGVIAAIVTRRPWWVIGIYAGAAIASALLAAFRLELKTDQDDLVSSKLPYHQRYEKFLRTFGDLEYLYVVIEARGDPERAAAAADAVAAEVAKLEDDVEAVFHRVPPEAFGRSLLLLSPREDLERLAAALEENLPLLRRVESMTGFADLFDLFAELLGASPEAGRSSGEWGLRFLDASLGAIARAARGEDPPPLDALADPSSWGDAGPRERGYLFSSNGALAFVEILPRKDYETLEVIEEPLRHIRDALSRVRERFPDVPMGLTGRPVLAADEMRVTNDDMTVSSVLAMVLVVGLFILFFRRLRRPLLAAISLMVALGITFGVVTLTIGYLTLLSIVFTVMLIGLGIDFGVLFISRYQEELIASRDVAGSIRSTLLSTGMGIWTGGLCTSFVFYSVLFANFKGLAELGFVAGTGLLICLASMLTFLPALLHVSDRYIQLRRVLKPPRPILLPFLGRVARYPRTVLVVFAALTAVGFLAFRGIPYNWNLLELQARGLESVEYELKIIEESDRSTWYAALIAKDLPEVDRILASLRPWQEKGIVGDVESARDVVPPDQEEKARVIRKAGGILAGLEVPGPTASLDPERLAVSLAALLDGLHHIQSLAASRPLEEAREAVRLLEGPITSVEGIEDALRDDPETASRRLGAYQERWFRELGEAERKLAGFLDPPPITPASLPPDIRRRFVSGEEESRYLLYVYPRRDIWIEEYMEEFVGAVRAVDPDVTGVPVHFFESARLMRQGFIHAAIYSFLMVFAILLIDFRSLKIACLTMTPVLVGLLWLFQLMPLFDLELNLANFFSLPILIGCAVDGAVHMVHRFRETGSTEEVGRTTGTAVCLASLSNMFGFASLGIARHQGVASLGIVTALGCATIMIAIIVLLPSLIEVIERGKLRPPGPPAGPRE